MALSRRSTRRFAPRKPRRVPVRLFASKSLDQDSGCHVKVAGPGHQDSYGSTVPDNGEAFQHFTKLGMNLRYDRLVQEKATFERLAAYLLILDLA